MLLPIHKNIFSILFLTLNLSCLIYFLATDLMEHVPSSDKEEADEEEAGREEKKKPVGGKAGQLFTGKEGGTYL